MRIVAAVGGNALLPRHEPADAAVQRQHARDAVAALGPLARHHQLIVTHGNGPQVGLLALQAEAYPDVAPYPLDILGAETQGMVGYLLDQEFASQLPGRPVATLLTQVEVDPHDPAFDRPTKPIGPLYDPATAKRVGAARGWTVGPDADGYRRLVPSPEPRRIVELTTVLLLAEAGVLVIAAGGGGIPVIAEGPSWRGVEAVVDKDLTASLLAVTACADTLLLVTDIDAVYLDWDTPRAAPLQAAHPDALRRLGLAPGSMGPKVEAAARFTEQTGYPAFIGPLTAAADVLSGQVGTRVARDVDGLIVRYPYRSASAG